MAGAVDEGGCQVNTCCDDMDSKQAFHYTRLLEESTNHVCFHMGGGTLVVCRSIQGPLKKLWLLLAH